MIDVDLSRRCYLIECTCVATNPDSIRKGKESVACSRYLSSDKKLGSCFTGHARFSLLQSSRGTALRGSAFSPYGYAGMKHVSLSPTCKRINKPLLCLKLLRVKVSTWAQSKVGQTHKVEASSTNRDMVHIGSSVIQGTRRRGMEHLCHLSSVTRRTR